MVENVGIEPTASFLQGISVPQYIPQNLSTFFVPHHRRLLTYDWSQPMQAEESAAYRRLCCPYSSTANRCTRSRDALQTILLLPSSYGLTN